MNEKEKIWLSDYTSKHTIEKKERISARELLKMTLEQTQELRIFLKSVSKTRQNQREPYEELLKAET